MVTKDRTVWILLIFILCGLVIGGLLGELSKNIEWLWWLGYGQEFGLTAPLVLDLSVIKLSFSFTVKISIASIIGMILAIFIYRKA
ncbi:MAG: DUF4321 domain-containing protein [Clostridia bacterium]|nr:DUF4321 domain-containing protein [Clostridia bacterium]